MKSMLRKAKAEGIGGWMISIYTLTFLTFLGVPVGVALHVGEPAGEVLGNMALILLVLVFVGGGAGLLYYLDGTDVHGGYKVLAMVWFNFLLLGLFVGVVWWMRHNGYS